MYLVQQLSSRIRRIRWAPEGTPDRLPDPAIGDWGRAQLADAPVHRFASLEEAASWGTGDESGTIALTKLERRPDGSVRIAVGLEEDERLYGAYDSDAHGFDRRGDHVHLVAELHTLDSHRMTGACDLCGLSGRYVAHQDDLSLAERFSHYGELIVPFVISSSGWGLYVSSAWHDAVLDLGARDPRQLTYSAPGGEADVYLIAPCSIGEASAEFVRLTGRQPLPPAWSHGYLQSRFGYESFDHVHDVLERFEQESLPVHGVIFDVQWLEQHVNLRWDPVNFPDPVGNLARIAARGVRALVITEPGTQASASNHAEGVDNGYWAVNSDGSEFDSDQWYAKRGIEGYREIEPSTGALLNVFREDAADWWYEQHRQLIDQGIDAWWLDLNEPEDVTPDVEFRSIDWPAPRDVVRGDEVRNLFAITQQRLFARRDRRSTDRRPFVISRSGSAGSQRYGAAPWSGDVGATWTDLQHQPRLALSAGLCGFPMWGCDVGGFSGDPGPELFARWLQLGSVLPVFRAHGYMADREPWSQGAECLEAARPAIMLRAQLLPSINSWAWHALRAGEPIARPMLLGPLGTQRGTPDAAVYGRDPRWANIDDQWFYGPMLVAPVLEAGATSRTIELPDGEWVHVASGDAFDGCSSIELPVTLESLPMFVPRTTALVVDPAPLAGRGHSWPPSELEVWSWAGEGEVATCELYLDDGFTRMHEQGAYCLQRIDVQDGAISVERIGGSWPASRLRVAEPSPGRAVRVVGAGGH